MNVGGMKLFRALGAAVLALGVWGGTIPNAPTASAAGV